MKYDWDNVDWTKNNCEIARDLGAAPRSVWSARERLGIKQVIKRKRSGSDWNRAIDNSKSNNELAYEYNVNETVVRQARKIRGLKSDNPSPKIVGIDWDNQPLGQISDAEISRKLDVGKTGVRLQRIKRNIAPYSGYVDSSPKGIDWYNVPLGKVSDEVLARQLGVSSSCVTRKRNELGIDPLFDNGVRGIDWDSVDWNKTDTQISRETKVSVTSVKSARRANGGRT